MGINPMTMLLVQVLLSTLVVGMTSATSVFRLAALPLMATFTGLIIRNSMAYMVRAPWAALVGGYSISFLLQYLDVALLSRCSFDGTGASNSATATTSPALTFTTNSFILRIKWALSLLVNFRFIDTPQHIKNVPKFSTRDPDYIPSRKQFLFNTAVTAVLSYLILDLLTSSADPEMSSKYLSSTNIPFFTRLSEISGPEVLIRIGSTICLGVSMNCVQGGIYSIMGFISVLFGLSQPNSWPPFYGPLLRASSLRKFWAVYWHQINTRKLMSLSNFVLLDIYELDPDTTIARYLRLVIIFIVSGLMHLFIDISSGIPLQDSGAINFFLVQILGILAEDSFLRVYRALVGVDHQQSLTKRFVGYLWVLSFLCWSVPAYLYPILSKSGQEHSTVPFSIVNKVKHGTW